MPLLGRGAAMIIESLQLYYHIHCFQCCVCQAQLGNGSCGTDVRVRNNKLHCHNCYSNDEGKWQFSFFSLCSVKFTNNFLQNSVKTDQL